MAAKRPGLTQALGIEMEATGYQATLTLIPLWNIREEFYQTQQLVNSEDFCAAMRDHRRPVKTPLITWNGNNNDLVSLLVQRAVQGLESYMTAAVISKLNSMKLASPDTLSKAKNPFSIKRGSGTAEAYFHNLPALLHPDHSLKLYDPDFWPRLVSFYKNVRNPLFHGHHFKNADAQDAILAFRTVDSVYTWLDQWYTCDWKPNRKIMGIAGFNA